MFLKAQAPTPPVQQDETQLDLAAAAKMLRVIRSGSCPTTEAGWRADAMYVVKAALNDLNDPYASETLRRVKEANE